MSQDPHGPGRSQNESSGAQDGLVRSAGGSVKRARQQVKAGVPQEQSQRVHDPTVGRPASPGARAPLQQLGQGDYVQEPSQGYAQGLILPEDLDSGLRENGLLVSRSSPSPMPQWPLREEDESSRRRNNSPTNERPKAKGPPPQRPPRPNYVPSILDSSKMQGKVPLHNQRGPLYTQKPQTASQQQQYHWEKSQSLSPGQELGTPGTMGTGTSSSSSRPSTSSSVGSIPEFPTPSIPSLLPSQQTRRSANLGPPPTSRRGASSYYSQSSYVTPIPEELPEHPNSQNPHEPYASSHLMPTSWGDGPPEYYLGETTGEEAEEVLGGEGGRECRGGDHDESTGLVRKASLGKRHKPSLTTIRSSDGSDREEANRTLNNHQLKRVDAEKPSLVSRAALAAGSTGGGFAVGVGSSKNEHVVPEKDVFEGGTGFLDSPSSSNGSAFKNSMLDFPSGASDLRPGSPVTAAVDDKVKEIMGSLKRGGALESGTPSPVTSPSLLTGDKLFKRPPHLNIEAAKNADARASLTSLPELIRRATKLASNLDRGRTASRLGMRDMLGPGDMGEKGLSSNGRPHSGSITHILASFPPPGLSTPTPTSDRPASRWPSPFATSNPAMGQPSSVAGDTMEFNEKKRSRKCCGMSIWCFILLLIILVFLVTAAVVIPITLIVLPRQRTARLNAAAAAGLTNCQITIPCANGGTSIVTANACSCICANGFTGATCNQIADAGCITTDIEPNDQSTSRLTNVTLGSSIPRLLSAAQSNFSIPLNSSRILSMFSVTNLSCTSENALVTFNGQSQRRGLSFPQINLDPFFSMSHQASPTIFPRQDAPTSQSSMVADNYPASTIGVYTSNGLILAGSTSVTPTVATPVPTATTTTTSSASSVATNQPISKEDLDFARVAVLYIFQLTKLDEAVLAQEKLQAFFVGGGFNGSTLNVGADRSVDFGTRTVSLGNGTVVGAQVG
ncbi:MAG: hypothetical protein Q9187_002797 [Circinaria calcarea]